jgi:uncharacterized membrane protein YphA (DoxX/SURF4 family)
MHKLIDNIRNLFSKGIPILIWIISALMAYDFVLQGWRKFDPQGWWAPAFENWGYPTWFMMLIGLMEVAGAVLLIIPQIRYIGAMLLIVVMVGAVVTKSLHKISIDEVLYFISAIATLLLMFGYGYEKRQENKNDKG